MDEFCYYDKGQLWILVGGGLCVLLDLPNQDKVLVAPCVTDPKGLFVKTKYKQSKIKVAILFDKPKIISINNLFSQIGKISCRKLSKNPKTIKKKSVNIQT